jgi:hypothetical protein
MIDVTDVVGLLPKENVATAPDETPAVACRVFREPEERSG